MGLQAAQEESGIDLVGGDTCATLGPLTVTVTAIGLLPQGEAVLRRGAIAGDRLYVSGTIGDAALGLKLLRAPWLEVEWGLSPDEGAFLVDRYRCPRRGPRLPCRCGNAPARQSTSRTGSSATQPSSALASGVSATIEAARVPLSDPAVKAVARKPELLAELITAGDDYEIVAAMEASHASGFEKEAQDHGVTVTAIGEVGRRQRRGRGRGRGGRPLKLLSRGSSISSNYADRHGWRSAARPDHCRMTIRCETAVAKGLGICCVAAPTLAFSGPSPRLGRDEAALP